MLRVSRVHFPVTALGPGRRLGIWLQGCPLACPGCMSTDTWLADAGREVAIEDLVDLWRTALADGADGLTISGGEPLTQPEPLGRFLDAAAEIRPATADFLLYTGFELSEFDDAQSAVLDRVDAVVTGRFLVEKPTALAWRGSANQELVPRTDLGERRYREHVHRSEPRPAVQVAVDDGRLWLIGIPPRGTLIAMERALRADGIRLRDVAWRR
jgi:anaerobic ribonucleoside-triphosphate reductase activating protein